MSNYIGRSIAYVAQKFADIDCNRDYHIKGRSLYTKRGVCYSYGEHFPIAVAKVSDMHGVKFLFTTERYSITTSRHTWAVYSAIRDKWGEDAIIKCPLPLNSPSSNFFVWQNRLEALHKKLSKARKPELYTGQIDYIESEVRKYAQFVGADIPTEVLTLFEY